MLSSLQTEIMHSLIKILIAFDFNYSVKFKNLDYLKWMKQYYHYFVRWESHSKVLKKSTQM